MLPSSKCCHGWILMNRLFATIVPHTNHRFRTWESWSEYVCANCVYAFIQNAARDIFRILYTLRPQRQKILLRLLLLPNPDCVAQFMYAEFTITLIWWCLEPPTPSKRTKRHFWKRSSYTRRFYDDSLMGSRWNGSLLLFMQYELFPFSSASSLPPMWSGVL